MDYNRVALFVRVVRAGSFTGAAAAVGLPKSSVSRAIAQLERELGVRLLQRTTRKLGLTEAGQAYFDAVAGSVQLIDEADAAARERGAAPSGTVRLTAPPDAAPLAPALVRFARKYPGIRVELTITSRFVDLVGEGIDLALRAGRLEDSGLIARRVSEAVSALMAAPAYLRERGRPRTIADLPAHAFILYRASGGRARLSLTGPDGPSTIEVTGALVADDLTFCRAAAEAGGGIALLPVLGMAEGLRAGNLELVLPEWTARGAGVYVVLPSARQVPARVALVRDFLVEDIGRQLADTDARCRATARRRGARRG